MAAESSKPFIGVYLRCAGIYTRLHATDDRQAFCSHCAKCGQSVRVEARELQPGSRQHLFDCGRNRRPI